ncbi:hypothetical protein KFK09_015703 [Dendrobium nobile]|uniref:Uncharacterized protein n=1 Tax=Dendrobium nobile TaxID=94219 RepID=A0A8T3B5K2_DENNO|nr:hypothetical protein KFK09_015703 [Dendrobium nobile]
MVPNQSHEAHFEGSIHNLDYQTVSKNGMLILINNNLEAFRGCLSSSIFFVATRLHVAIARVASSAPSCFVQLRFFDNFPFLSDQKL